MVFVKRLGSFGRYRFVSTRPSTLENAKSPVFKRDQISNAVKTNAESKVKELQKEVYRLALRGSGITEKQYRKLSNTHLGLLQNEQGNELRTALDDETKLKSLIFSSMIELAMPNATVEDQNRLKKALQYTVFGDPGRRFPKARQMDRRIYAHVGPTNSGKTFSAIKRLKEGQNGAYCGPLRLLAMEMYDKLNREEFPCALITGECIERPMCKPELAVADSPFVSSTVEMFDFERRYDCVVIDEIQMMADPERGWAFTQVLLGANSPEIHVCGESSIVPLLHKIARRYNEVVEVFEYQRLSPLHMKNEPVWDPNFLEKGDCVVTFSRAEAYRLRKAVEAAKKEKCAIVYGALPMESRRQQAKLFNDPNSGYNYIVATDAIGMGLNLY